MTATSKSTYIIIGAGLSGLHAAFTLHKAGASDFIILEARDRLGGRVWTQNGIDFGAVWFQNHHDTMIALSDELSLTRFHQFAAGKSVLVYSSMAPAHEFITDPNAPSAFRIAGGTQELVKALADPIRDHIKLQCLVKEVRSTTNGVEVVTAEEVFEAKHVIVALPPRLANGITYSPLLPEHMHQVMEKTHTWMSNAIKVGITFDRPFWRDKGFSGTLIGQVGAVTELYDHSSEDHTKFSLMGFVNEGLRELSAGDRKKRILNYIATYLGEEVHQFLTYNEKDWSQDRLTSSEKLHSVYLSPSYGKPEFRQSYLNNRLHFTGAETSQIHGGYMDGALRSGRLTAQRLLNLKD